MNKQELKPCLYIKKRDEKTFYTRCQCIVDNHYLSYMTVMEGWCRHWAKGREKHNEK